MGRPQKQTVDYFPHYAGDSRTMFILENSWGNDGYAFWFKLLELLCKTDGHYYNYSENLNKMYFLAQAKISGDTAEAMLNMLAEMGKIDYDLWSENKVIWCQSLVDNLAPVYASRKKVVPQRPFSYQAEKPAYTGVSSGETPINDDSHEFLPVETTTDGGMLGVSTTENPQSRVEYSRVEESKGETHKDACVSARADDPPIAPAPNNKTPPPIHDPLAVEHSEGFHRFWAEYPRKDDRAFAVKEWSKLNMTPEFEEQIIAGIKLAKGKDPRFQGEYRFIPIPAKWLEARGWENEFLEKNDKTGGSYGDGQSRGFNPASRQSNFL